MDKEVTKYSELKNLIRLESIRYNDCLSGSTSNVICLFVTNYAYTQTQMLKAVSPFNGVHTQ